MDSWWREPVTIEIRYNCGKGHMTVNLNKFFEDQTISKMKKLINLVQRSDTPDQEDIIWEFIREDYQMIPGMMKAYANDYADKKDEISRLEKILHDLILVRDRISGKRMRSEFQKAKVNPCREALASARSDMYWNKVLFNKYRKTSEIYEKLSVFYGKPLKTDEN